MVVVVVVVVSLKVGGASSVDLVVLSLRDCDEWTSTGGVLCLPPVMAASSDPPSALA